MTRYSKGLISESRCSRASSSEGSHGQDAPWQTGQLETNERLARPIQKPSIGWSGGVSGSPAAPICQAGGSVAATPGWPRDPHGLHRQTRPVRPAPNRGRIRCAAMAAPSIAPVHPAPGDVAALHDLVARGDVLVLTGAGISTDSGIPDYRGPSGQLRNAPPMTFQHFIGSADERQRYWARSHLGWQHVARARPNAAHHALATLDRAGLVSATVTQNVDGLHTAAGSRDVIDVHGRLDTVVCLGCDERRPRLELMLRLDVCNPGFRERHGADGPSQRPDGDVRLAERAVTRFRVVECRVCGGVLKPDVVFFGEHVPPERFRRALARLDASASLLVLGSSLTVGSGFRFVTAARRRGLPIAIVNRGATRGDPYATVRLDAGLAEVLAPLADGLVAGRTPRPATESGPGRSVGQPA
jgi:NAD-dependent SIR2 family protein deacetylase